MQILAVAGLECEENRQIVEYVYSGKDWKQSPPSHPVRTLGSVMEEVGVEDTAKGLVVVISGTRVLVPRQEHQTLLEVLHETHLGVGTMLATAMPEGSGGGQRWPIM